MLKVVVTGLGIISCLGRGKKTVWDNLKTGKHGYAPLDLPGFRDFRCHTAGHITDDLLGTDIQNIPPFLSRHEHLGLIAAEEALQDAEWLPETYDHQEVGVASGIGAAGMLEAEEWLTRLSQSAKRHPAKLLHGYPASSLADFLANTYNFKGLRFSIATACSSSGTSLGMAADAIKNGRAEAFLAVGSEALSLLTYAGFHSLRSMSPDVCRPFDKERKGLILGEGAAAIVLEREDRAEKRGAKIYGEILGWGLSSDGYHMTAPDPEGNGAVRAMAQAIDRAGLSKNDIEYINLHGTGTQHNDLAETKAVKNLFGGHAHNLLVSSTKSMTGHCLGAAGAIESLITLLALHHGAVPPTANHVTPDPACDLNYVPLTAQPAPNLKYAMNNVMAFGGNNVALVFGKRGAST